MLTPSSIAPQSDSPAVPISINKQPAATKLKKTDRRWNLVRNRSLRWNVWNKYDNQNDMRINLCRTFVGLAVVCFVLSFGQSLVAAPSPAAGLLVQAYTALEQADHDYKGHRIAAMKQIEAAARLLGVNVWGEGRGHEQQGISDAQLRTAQGLLQQAQSGLSGKPLRHVNKALQQLSIALSIK